MLPDSFVIITLPGSLESRINYKFVIIILWPTTTVGTQFKFSLAMQQ